MAAILLQSACSPDETISGYADPSATYRLTTLNGVAFTDRATIQFPEAGKIIGSGPCNSYQTTQTMPYPWFEIGPIASTRMACPASSAETTFFQTLAAMSFAEAAGQVLLLTNSDGMEMVFQAE